MGRKKDLSTLTNKALFQSVRQALITGCTAAFEPLLEKLHNELALNIACSEGTFFDERPESWVYLDDFVCACEQVEDTASERVRLCLGFARVLGQQTKSLLDGQEPNQLLELHRKVTSKTGSWRDQVACIIKFARVAAKTFEVDHIHSPLAAVRLFNHDSIQDAKLGVLEAEIAATLRLHKSAHMLTGLAAWCSRHGITTRFLYSVVCDNAGEASLQLGDSWEGKKTADGITLDSAVARKLIEAGAVVEDEPVVVSLERDTATFGRFRIRITHEMMFPAE